MQKNIHDYERIGRVIGGGLLASLAFWGPKQKWYLAFAVPAIEGLIGTCALYSAFGIDTRQLGKKTIAHDYFQTKRSFEAGTSDFVGVP